MKKKVHHDISLKWYKSQFKRSYNSTIIYSNES